jgi:hypothetical protein
MKAPFFLSAFPMVSWAVFGAKKFPADEIGTMMKSRLTFDPR